MTNFISVSTSAARFQDLSLNPQKLAGQCAKLKCCLNYEVDQYVESLKRLPSKEIVLQTQDNDYYFFKADILNHVITYSTDKHILANESTISARRAFEIIKMNREGKKPEALTEDGAPVEVKSLDLLEQENINRFDNSMQRNGKKRRKGGRPDQRRGNDRREKDRNNSQKDE
jgi:cell fate regulator YaaT (PSP1 superfamily)